MGKNSLSKNDQAMSSVQEQRYFSIIKKKNSFLSWSHKLLSTEILLIDRKILYGYCRKIYTDSEFYTLANTFTQSQPDCKCTKYCTILTLWFSNPESSFSLLPPFLDVKIIRSQFVLFIIFSKSSAFQLNPRKPLPIISELLVIIINAVGSTSFIKRRRRTAWLLLRTTRTMFFSVWE